MRRERTEEAERAFEAADVMVLRRPDELRARDPRSLGTERVLEQTHVAASEGAGVAEQPMEVAA